MSENALIGTAKREPCQYEELKGELEAIKERLDHIERELALVTGKEDRGGFFSWILGKR